MSDPLAGVKDAFAREFSGATPEAITRAPGRIDLMGGHTDYNEGFVLSIAIDRAIYVAARPRADGIVRAYSDHFDHTVEFPLAQIDPDAAATWSNYVRGVALMLQQAGHALTGIDAAIYSTVPVGSGVSSSAAIELATCLAFTACAGLELDRLDMARLCQRAENEFVGMKCGILDQFSSVFGREDHALLIDCRSLDHEAAPLDQEAAAFVVLDTKKERPLVDSAYNERRGQCEEAVRLLAEALPGVRALRDVSPEDFERHQERLPQVVRRRAQHVVYENARVLQCAELSRAGDMRGLGHLQHESQASLRDLYEVSCRELDAITRAAERHPACHGARLVGAGFGGCAGATVERAAVDEFIAFTAVEYEAELGYAPDIYATRASRGAEVVT